MPDAWVTKSTVGGAMYSVTTFEWHGGFVKIPVASFEAQGGPRLLIASLEISIRNDREGCMHLVFAMEKTKHHHHPNEWAGSQHARELLGELGHCASRSRNWDDHYLYFRPVSGETITTTMMRQYINLMTLCGISPIRAPRVLSESFVGNSVQQTTPVSYGGFLCNKLLGRKTAHDPEAVL